EGRPAALAGSWRRGLRHGGKRPRWDERPVREELFSIERLEEHGRSLAAAQVLAYKPGHRDELVPRLASNEQKLLAAYRDIAEAISAGEAITPAAEWLIDNFYVVEKQIRQ